MIYMILVLMKIILLLYTRIQKKQDIEFRTRILTIYVFDDEYKWVDSDEDNTPREEESDEVLDEEYDFETKVYDYLNELIKDEVFENNDMNSKTLFN
jgi:hypothetical protein